MTFLTLLLVLVAIAAAAPFLGRDSLDLRDDHPEVPWDRLPR